MRKKDYPLVINEALEPFVGLYSDTIYIVRNNNSLLEARDADIHSNFYFKVLSYKKVDKSNDFMFIVEQQPRSARCIEVAKPNIKISELKDYFDKWENLIKAYNNTKSLFDDPAYTSFYEEYYSEFNITKDSYTKGFSSNQIIIIDNLLNNVNTYLDSNNSQKHQEQILEIKNNILTLQENLTNESQYIIITMLASIFAKICKLGVPFIKGLSKIFKEKIVEGIVEQIVQKNLPSDLF